MTASKQRLHYDIDIQDDSALRMISLNGRLTCLGGSLPQMQEDARFTCHADGQALLFSASLPYEGPDFMPETLHIIRDFYPQPVERSLPCDFKVRLRSEQGTAFATGFLQEERFTENNVDSFALVLSDSFPALTDSWQGIQLRCLYYPQNQALARTVLDQAKSSLAACIELFGFFPYRALTFVPGSTRWSGGCPLATGVLGLHHKPDAKVLLGNNSIITHEICHEYWGEYVKDSEATGWLGIGLGLASDLALSGNPELHQHDLALYKKACQAGRRTALDLPLQEFEALMDLDSLTEYDYNSAVLHGKSWLIMEKIQQAIGRKAFFAALSSLLQTQAGQAINREHFLAAIRRHSGQDFSRQLQAWLKSDACIL